MSDIHETIKNALIKFSERQKKIHESRDWDAWDTAQEILGFPGTMISGSKTAFPDHKVVWNSNVCTKEHGKIWFGDLDLTVNENKIKELAQKLNIRVYVLYEMDARFDNELKPLLKEAVYSVDENGGVKWKQ